MKVDVLIVDDSPILRRSIRKAVLMSGVDESGISEAGNGAEALESIRQKEPDLVLLDINMPVMDGEEFLVEVERSGEFPEMSVIIVSTETNAKRLIRLGALGAKGRLKKPFEPEDLRKILLRQLGEKKLDMGRLVTASVEDKVIQALERMFFTSVDPVGTEAGEADLGTHATIEILGPVDRSEVVLSASDDFLRDLASSLLGVDHADVDLAEEGLQGLQELANVLCGEVIELLGGEERRISCSLPYQVEEPRDGGQLVLGFETDEGHALRLTIPSPAPY